MMVRGALGLAPWDVLHSGVTRYLPITLGQAVIVLSFVVMLAWIPLREVPGLGTILNALLVGSAADLTLWLLDQPDVDAPPGSRSPSAASLLCGLASALYIGAQFGRGPRDGLMTGLSRRTGLSLRLVRTGLEVSVVVLGLLLGGVAGFGTVLYALAIGPLTQLMLPWCTVALPERVDGGFETCALARLPQPPIIATRWLRRRAAPVSNHRRASALGGDEGGGVGGDHHLDGGEPLVGQPLLAQGVDPAVEDRRPAPRTA